MLPRTLFTGSVFNMEDPILNQSLEETRELHTRWGQFRDFVLMAVKSRKVTAQAEMKFLELKSRIAMLHDGFMARLDHDQKTGQNIMSIVGDCILLKRCAAYTDAEKQKFEFDWNECYLLVTEQVGSMEEEQKRLAAVNIREYNAQRRRELMAARMHNFLHSTGLKVFIGVTVLLLVVWILPAMDIVDYTKLGTMPQTKKAYKPIVNSVVRPYLNKDLTYVDVTEPKSLKRDPKEDTKLGIGRNDKLENLLSKDFFLKTIVKDRAWKFKPADQARISDAAKNALMAEKEAYTIGNLSASIMLFYFPPKDGVKEATAFVDAVTAAAKNAGEAKKVSSQWVMFRRANIVSIGISEHNHRGWAGDKYQFEQSDNLIKAQ